MFRVRQGIRIAFLFFYAVYAFTPVHMYAMAGRSSEHHRCSPLKRHATTDIVWANVLFSSLVDENNGKASSTELSTRVRSGGDVVLAKKRRTLVRELFDGKPLLEMKNLSLAETDRPIAGTTIEYETAIDPLVRETNAALSLNSGLSPPSHLP